jgi:glyoxylase-like metal-dependent hydrolase (beta-lactamase superfamily II)
MDAPLISWYIEGSDKKILVDTGGVDPTKAHPRWNPYKREKDQSIENVLKKFGMTCEDIDIVIVTHLHWDHCGGNGLFPKAKIIVQQEELQSARSPLPISAHSYSHIKTIVEDINYTIISGDKEIAKGVTAILTPGHTYGMQGVLVEARKRRFMIAGDTFGLFKNLEQSPPQISGFYVDLRKYYESIDIITKLSAFILPGHDFKVFEKKVYD